MRDATTSPLTPVPLIPFLSTRPMRDATSTLPLHYPSCIISIHASHAGRDPVALTRSSSLLFQSTRPMRDATNTNSRQSHHDAISIHASHAGRDNNSLSKCVSYIYFNPRVPCGTRRIFVDKQHKEVYFNPRVPCGTRPWLCLKSCMRIRYFNPRVPCGTRRYQVYKGEIEQEISIHASHAGRDLAVY